MNRLIFPGFLFGFASCASVPQELQSRAINNSKVQVVAGQVIEVSIVGSVSKPGTDSVESGSDIRRVMEHAGGFDRHAATTIRLTRKGEGTFVLDIAEIIRMDVAVLVADGDAIFVPEKIY